MMYKLRLLLIISSYFFPNHFNFVSAHLHSIALLPHGDYAYEPDLIDDKNGSLEIHQGIKRLVNDITQATQTRVGKPIDIILITTPHGMELDQDLLIYLNQKLQGKTRLEGWVDNLKYKCVDVEVTAIGSQKRNNGTDTVTLVTAGRLIQQALQTVQTESESDDDSVQSNYKTQSNVQIIQGFSDSKPLQLEWAEIIPLSFFSRKENTTVNEPSSHSQCPSYSHHLDKLQPQAPEIIVLSLPLSRFGTDNSTKLHQYTDYLKRIGAKLYGLFNGNSNLSLSDSLSPITNSQSFFKPLNILWLASGDMAHTHVKWGPYGYSESAKLYENAVKEWINKLNTDSFDKIEKYQHEGAASCGYSSLGMIEGALKASALTTNSRYNFQGQIYAHEVPTYYGMIVTRWSQSQWNRNDSKFNDNSESGRDSDTGHMVESNFNESIDNAIVL